MTQIIKKKKIFYLTFSKSNISYALYLKKILQRKFDYNIVVASKILDNFLTKKNVKFKKCYNFFSENFDVEKNFELKIQIQEKKYFKEFKNFIIKVLKFLKIYELKNYFFFFTKIFFQYAWTFLFFHLNKIDILIVPGDRECIQELSLIKFCHNKKIPVIILSNIPYPGDRDSLITFNFRTKHIISKDDKNFLNKYKIQVTKYKNTYLSFYGYYNTKVYHYLGILPENPWIIGGGYSDKVLIESKFVNKNYLFNTKKTIVVGSHAIDSIKKNLEKKSRIFNDSRINLLVNITNWYEHGELNFSDHFRIINSKLDLLYKVFKNKKHVSLYISLHPKQNYSNYRYIEEKYQFKVLKKKTQDIISEVDGIISLSSSSIMIWAEYLGIDFYLIDIEPSRHNHHVKIFKKVKIIEENKIFNKLNKNFKKVSRKSKIESFNKKINNKKTFQSNIIDIIDNLVYGS